MGEVLLLKRGQEIHVGVANFFVRLGFGSGPTQFLCVADLLQHAGDSVYSLHAVRPVFVPFESISTHLLYQELSGRRLGIVMPTAL